MAKRRAVLLAILAFVALLGGGAATGVFEGWLRAPPPTSGSPGQATADPEAAMRPGLRGGAARPAPPVPASVDEALPPPVDLEKVDRDRDLHGVVVTQDGKPVAGATLIAVRFPWRRGRLLRRDDYKVEEESGRATSARDGTFAIRLPRGEEVELRATSPGFAEMEMGSCQAGERVRVVLVPGVRLIVTVKERGGAPLKGLRLSLDRWERFGGPRFERTATTDGDGRCAFDNLPGDCTCSLSVEHETLGAASYTRITLPATGEATETVEVPAARTISGLVTDVDTGAPIAGALVAPAFMLESRPAATGADGRFAITGWRGDSFLELRAFAKGYANRFAEAGAKAKSVNFKLQHGFAVRARVVDGSARPIAAAHVGAVGPTVEMSNNATMGSATSNAEGVIEIDGLDPKIVHALAVVADGFGLILLDFDPPAKGQSVVDLGDVTLPASRAIEGRVVDAEERPVAGVWIRMEGANADRGRLRPNGRGRGPDEIQEERMTDDLGRFRFRDLAPGVYALGATTEGLPDRSIRVTLTADHDLLDVEFRYPRLHELLVVVADAAGHPVAGARVEAADDDGQEASTQTDATGKARLACERPPETVRVVWFAEGVGPYLVPPSQDVAEDQHEVRFVAEPAGHASGVVLGPDGKPLLEASIEAVRDGVSVSQSQTEAGGKFGIDVPASGTFSLVLHPQKLGEGHVRDRPLLEGRVDGLSAGAEGVTLRAHAAPRDRRIEVLVLAPDGSPAAGVTVSVDAVTGGGSLETGPDGRTEFDALPAVVVDVGASPGDGVRDGGPWIDAKSQSVVPNGQRIVLRLRRPTRLLGRLLGPGGLAVEGAKLEIRPSGDTYADWMLLALAADGRFGADVDPDLAYTLRGRAPIGNVPHQAVRKGVRARDGEVTLALEPVK